MQQSRTEQIGFPSVPDETAWRTTSLQVVKTRTCQVYAGFCRWPLLYIQNDINMCNYLQNLHRLKDCPVLWDMSGKIWILLGGAILNKWVSLIKHLWVNIDCLDVIQKTLKQVSKGDKF